MHFLYPAFLFAFAALAIPVIVHLFNFRRYQKVHFSNVQFLKALQEQQASRRNLKERLILAARLLTLIFLILAFARPFIPGKQAINTGKQQAVSIFVDNSYSMQTPGKEGTLLDEAKHQAKQIAALYGNNDRFQVLTHDFEGRHQRLLSRDAFDDAVDAVKISPQSRSLQQIINRQQSLLGGQPGSRSLYILSDFQAGMAKQPVKADTGVNLNFILLKANKLPNVAVDSAWLLSAVHRPGDNEKLVVRLHNYADGQAIKIPLKLAVNGMQKALGSFTLAPRAVQQDTLSFSGLQAGWQQGELSLQDNPVTFDNQFYFTFNVQRQMPLLIINGGTENKYLDALFATDSFFAVKNVNDGNVDYAALNTYPCIILTGVRQVAAGLAQQLKNYAARGGQLVIFPDVNADVVNYKTFLLSLNAAYLQKLVTADTKVAMIDTRSRVFKNVFDQMPGHPDLPVVKKYYQLSQPGHGTGEILMALAGGEPFFAGYPSGRGRVYLSAVPLNDDFSNLQRHALLLPMLFRIALLSGHEQPLFYTLGRDERIELPPVQLNEKQVLKLTKGNMTIIPDARQQEGGTALYIADQVKETGTYTLKKQDSILALLAFNDNRKESDLSYLSAAGLKDIAPNARLVSAAGPSVQGELTGTDFGLQLWKLCIILALIFIAAEILLIRYYKIEGRQEKSPI